MNIYFLQKLENRRKAIDGTPLRPSDVEKAKEILCSPHALDFMSSEESDQENQGPGPKPRKRLRLSWERKKLSNLKEALDRQHQSSMSAKQKRTSGLVRQAEEFSNRMPPEGSPSWAVRLGE